MRVSTTFHFWVNPPSTQLPVRRREIRFAVGVPNGASTNSWKLWVRRDEAYLACRDNFREFKLSLHASGIWGLAFTSEAVTRNSALQTPDEDRLIRRWTPDLTSEAVITGFGFST